MQCLACGAARLRRRNAHDWRRELDKAAGVAGTRYTCLECHAVHRGSEDFGEGAGCCAEMRLRKLRHWDIQAGVRRNYYACRCCGRGRTSDEVIALGEPSEALREVLTKLRRLDRGELEVVSRRLPQLMGQD